MTSPFTFCNYWQVKDSVDFGKALSIDLLERKGYKILHRDWKLIGSGKLDVVAKLKEEIVFVKVNIKSKRYCGPISYLTNPTKQQHTKKLAQEYIAKMFNNKCVPYRFDVVYVLFGNNGEIYHLEDAFQA